MSELEVTRVEFDPLRDKSYQHTRLGAEVVNFLAWKELGGTAPRTLDTYERALARGCLMFPHHGLEEFGDAEMLHVARAFKAGERRTRCAAWSSFFKWALKTRRTFLNPTDALPDMKQPPKRVIDIFSDEEIAILTGLPIRDGALMQLLFDAGLRKGEARNLRLMHLRPSPPPGEVVVLKGKGGKDRVIRATLAVSQRLNELAILDGLSQRDYLWFSRPGGGSVFSREKPINDASFAHWWRRCLEEADVRYRNPHTTRHTFATRWLRRGGRLSTLSDALGHASIATTDDIYGHLDTTDMAADLALIESFGNPSGAEG